MSLGLRDLAARHDQKLRYPAVSGWNYVFGNLVYIALVTVFGKQYYLWMLIPTNVVGITNNFLGFKFLVFRTKGHYLAEYFRSYVVYAPMVAVQFFALPVMVHFAHLDPRIANPIWGVVAFVFAYFAHRFFTFRTTEEKFEAIEGGEGAEA